VIDFIDVFFRYFLQGTVVILKHNVYIKNIN